MKVAADSAVEYRASRDVVESRFRRVVRRVGLGALLVVAFLGLAIIGPLALPYDPFQTNSAEMFLPPSARHWLGTDEMGRDVMVRICMGARVSLVVGVGAALIGLVFGGILGFLSGYFGGAIDSIFSRVVDLLLSFPDLIVALIISVFIGSSLSNVVVCLGIVAAPRFARLVRGQTLFLRRQLHVFAARSLGASHTRIILRHILPHTLPVVIVELTLTVASAVMTEASLSFLGYGVAPPNTSWGMMLKRGYSYLAFAPWIPLAPATAAFLCIFGFSRLGEGLQHLFEKA